MSRHAKLLSVITVVFFALSLLAVNAAPGIDAVNPLKSQVAEAATTPKYVFYFIGDGLGASQRQVAEYFLREKTGNKNAKLKMNQLPVAGINTTHSADSLVTDSAAAGTALAAGYKTNNGMISVLPSGTKVKTLMEAAEDKGMGTGIISTTRLTHATPAVFAAHNKNRNNENEIAVDFLDSGVDFFAGGGYRHFVPQDWQWGKSKREDGRNVVEEFAAQGYEVFVGNKNGAQDFKSFNPTGQDKVFAAFTYSHMPYEVDRVNTNNKVPSLAEITDKGIDSLEKYPNGFFMMIEGGRIDHACHANDPAGAIHDTLAFDEAVKEAYEFYQEHPHDTLIVVVGDHETGGMGLGFGKNYFLKMNELVDVKVSVDDTLEGKYEELGREAFFKYISNNLGLDNLSAGEKAEIEKAMNLVDQGVDTGNTYGGYDPVAIACTHVVSERANLYWTTYAHSGTSIPMSTVGDEASAFSGYKDNTEIAKAMAGVMNFKLSVH